MTGINDWYTLAYIGHFLDKFGFIKLRIQSVIFSKRRFIILNQMDRSYGKNLNQLFKLQRSSYKQLIGDLPTLKQILNRIFQHGCKISFLEIILLHA